MNTRKRTSGEPIENLAIGTIIEVDGSRIIAEAGYPLYSGDPNIL